MLLADLVAASAAVAGTRRRLQKVGHLRELLERLAPDETATAVAYLAGRLPQGRIGIGPAAIRRAFPESESADATLDLADVDARLTTIAETRGAGSVARKSELLTDLFEAATAEEQRFLAALLFGELRQGALEAVMVEAVARTIGAPPGDVRRAVMVSGNVAAVAAAALLRGPEALDDFRIELFRPLQPMLAGTADSATEALDKLTAAGRSAPTGADASSSKEVAVEVKLDGARVQIHSDGDTTRVFTRNLREVTGAVPEVAEAASRFELGEPRQIILDGEILALHADGRPHPFQVTMRRFGRKLDVDSARETLPLSVRIFDCLHAEGADLIEQPLREWFATMERIVPADLLIDRLVTSTTKDAEAFTAATLEAGHEGVMVKSLAAPYDAGRRGSQWLKVKQAHTLDLVVLAVEWGSGRRQGKLSNIHVGALAEAADSSSSATTLGAADFVMLGKTFKGMTDVMLEWQTERFLELQTHRDGHVVYVRPEQVVEIAFNDVQESPQYPGGLSLRFARVVRYRDDKRADEADAINTVRQLLERNP